MYIRPRHFSTVATLIIILMSQTYDPHAALALQAVSPQVHDDRTVTFHLHAPQAMSVKLQGNVPEMKADLKKDAEGLWSVTVGPLQPNLYPYHFNVDGTRVIDPLNRHTKAWILNENLVEVPDHDDTPWQHHNVPHGQVHHHFYHSPRLNQNRELFVYTPPGYAESTDKLPVLYLCHGFGDDASGWYRVGKANFIADNLIAASKANPCIIVMPLGHVNIPKTTDATKEHAEENYVGVEKELIDGVMPLVENHYRTDARREGRAIAGLSMGGGQAIRIGLTHLDKFKYVHGYSSALDWHSCEEVLNSNVDAIIAAQPQLWIGCGTSDFLKQENESFEKWLNDKGIQHTYHWSKGGHTWRVWRDYLETTLNTAFR